MRGFSRFMQLSLQQKQMDTTATLEYLGDLQLKATHTRSGEFIITDAPVDNNGKGSAFSPTDLMATSLGLCMITIMGIAANNSGFSIEGTKARVTKIMASDPRRVGEVVIELDFPDHNYSEKQKQIIKQCAKICPVSQSLHPDLKQTVTFNFS